jgi:hypothetical protein
MPAFIQDRTTRKVDGSPPWKRTGSQSGSSGTAFASGIIETTNLLSRNIMLSSNRPVAALPEVPVVQAVEASHHTRSPSGTKCD